MSARWLLTLTTIVMGSVAARASAQPADEFDPAPLIKVAEQYSFQVPGQTPSTLQTQPIMVWSNPAVFDQKGVVLVWMHQQRPQVVATVFQSQHPDGQRIMFEAHSLAHGPLEGAYNQSRFWKLDAAGVAFRDAKEIAPAPVAARRQLQMRQLAREFQVVLTNEGGDKQSLRLLPTPVATYEPNTDQCSDGAMFAFAATGTDPDAFLLIETVRRDNAMHFQYGFARFHFRDLVATRKGETVWHVEDEPGMLNNFRGSAKYRNAAYTFFRAK